MFFPFPSLFHTSHAFTLCGYMAARLRPRHLPWLIILIRVRLKIRACPKKELERVFVGHIAYH